MALASGYAILKGHVIDGRPAHSAKDHYQIRVIDNEFHYRIAVNIRSVAKNFGPDLFFYLDEHFQHPMLEQLEKLPVGKKSFAPGTAADVRRQSGVALDFIRMNLFDRDDMKLLPGLVRGPNNDLNERIDALVQDMKEDEDSLIYVFGEAWHEPNTPDKFFGFKPGNGLHNIHMNQGDLTGKFAKEDGVYQDGGLIFHYATENRYVGFFTKFQSQSWHTDDK